MCVFFFVVFFLNFTIDHSLGNLFSEHLEFSKHVNFQIDEIE